MRHVLLFIVMAVLGLAPLFAEDASDTCARLQKELEAKQKELAPVQKEFEAKQKELASVQARKEELERECAGLRAKIRIHNEEAAKKQKQLIQEQMDNKPAPKTADDSGDRRQELLNLAVPAQKETAAAAARDKTEAPAEPKPAPVATARDVSEQEARLEIALLPNAEMILYHDKLFLQAGFNKIARSIMMGQLQKELSYEAGESSKRYSEAFTHFNFLYSSNATKAIEKSGSKINYEQIDWMMGWEADKPADIWDKDPQKSVTTALELTQLVHRGLMAEILNQDIRAKLRFWEFKATLSRDSVPGWTLYPVHCNPTVTTRYELLWAVADNRQLFFLGPAETVMRQLKAHGGEGRAASSLYASYKELRAQADGQPRLATMLFVNEEAVKKIDNLLMDFRRPGDMALVQYLRRTTTCHLLLTAEDKEMQAHMEVTFKDGVVSKDFHNLLKQMTVPVILGLFVKADLTQLTSVKEVEVDSKNGSTVTLNTRMPCKEFIKLLAAQEVVKFSTSLQESR